MAEPIPAEEQSNYETFRDCMSEPVLKALAAPLEKPKTKRKRHQKKNSKAGKSGLGDEIAAKENVTEDNQSHGQDAQASGAEDLGDFIEFVSADIFTNLPSDLRTLSYSKYKDSATLQETYSTPLSSSTYTHLLNLLPASALETLESSALLPANSDQISQRNLLLPVYTSYLHSVTSAPPLWCTTRTSACELCARDWVPLTYHHLIPKSVHDRVRKRAWHPEHLLNSVAWLCRACHSFVHRLATNEHLARRFYSLELILKGGTEEDPDKLEEVRAWVKWVGGVRWRSR